MSTSSTPTSTKGQSHFNRRAAIGGVALGRSRHLTRSGWDTKNPDSPSQDF